MGAFVLFIYPRTGRPDQPESADWALIPGARGCTAESCAFRDLAADYASLNLSIYGLSAQDAAEQHEAADRLHLPYPLLSDPHCDLGRALELPTFHFEGRELYRRSTLVIRAGVIAGAHLEVRDASTHPHDLLTELHTSAAR
jgi:peroxiredoxin